MFGIGALIRAFSKTAEWDRRSGELLRAIDGIEKEYNQPVLQMFTGIARFNAAERLLDATLVRRLAEKPSVAERRRIVDRYLQRSYEEYRMAREELNATPATRADVVVLGLALREIALTLDQEVDDFRGRYRTIAHQHQSEIQSSIQSNRDALDAGLLRLAEKVRDIGERTGTELHASVNASFEGLSKRVTERLAAADAQQSKKIATLNEETRNRLRKEQNDAFEKQDARVTKWMGEGTTRLSAFEQQQQAFIASMRKTVRIQHWIMAVTTIVAVIALLNT